VGLWEEPETGPGTDGKSGLRKHAGDMEILQILGALGIVIGILVTALIAIVPAVVDR
jgi:hypothetical protein